MTREVIREVINELKKYTVGKKNAQKTEISVLALNRLIFALEEQEPKTGHWILTDDDFVYCSECEDSYYERPIDASWYYCPHCGAKMESGV